SYRFVAEALQNVGDAFESARLVQEVTNARCGTRPLVLGGHVVAEHDADQPGQPTLRLRERVDAAALLELDVENADVGLGGTDATHRVVVGGRFADHLVLAGLLDQLDHAFAHGWRILDHEDLHGPQYRRRRPGATSAGY